MIPAWWKSQPSKEDKKLFQQALIRNIVKRKLQGDIPPPGIELYKSCLEDMYELDQKWKKVGALDFNMSKYKAHDSFGETIRY